MKTVTLPKLAARRENIYWTQKQLAKVAKVGVGTVWRAENGKPIRPANAAKLAQAVGRTVEQLSKPLVDFLTEASADYPLGLLSPEGRFHPVGYAEHSDEAYRVAEQVYPAEAKARKKTNGWLDGLTFLRERGWVDIHSDGYVNHSWGHKLTQAQRDFIFDLAMARHERAGGVRTMEVKSLMRVAGVKEEEGAVA